MRCYIELVEVNQDYDSYCMLGEAFMQIQVRLVAVQSGLCPVACVCVVLHRSTITQSHPDWVGCSPRTRTVRNRGRHARGSSPAADGYCLMFETLAIEQRKACWTQPKCLHVR